MDIANKEKGIAHANNPPSDNKFSFRGGFPICTWSIAAQNKYLDPKSLRVNGQFRLVAPTGGKPTNIGIVPNPTTGMALNSRIGVASCINQVTIANNQNQTLEVIRNYNRMLASLIPVTHSQSDLDTCNQVGDPASASRSFNSARAINETVDFSIPLRTGLFSGAELISLGSSNGVSGLNISIELAPDSQVVSGYRQYDDENVETEVLFTPIGEGAHYELMNMTLTYDLLVPSEDGQAIMSAPSTGSMTYNSFSQLYSVLNASEQTQNFNLGVSNALSVTHNFIETANINNYRTDGFSTGRLQNSGGPANINRLTYLRGSTRFPLDYELEVGGRTDLPGNQARPQTELLLPFIDSIKPYMSLDHSLMSVQTQNGVNDNITFNTTKTPRYYNTLAEPNQEVFGAGVNFDPLSKVGVSFKNTNYGVRIVSDLQGTNPNSIYTFVRSRNTLRYSPMGITITS
tara:strand:+ start:718 stop:2094 length:1377 start_codon:yes stop_codon:yes gene_type:complete